MTFPASPANYDVHTEGVRDFYADAGRWHKRKPMVSCIHGESAFIGNGNAVLGRNELARRAKTLISVKGNFIPNNPSYFGIAINANRVWAPATITQATGYMKWPGGGYNVKDWSSYEAPSKNIYWVTPASKDIDRLVVNGRSASFDFKIMRATANSVLVRWNLQHSSTSPVATFMSHGCFIWSNIKLEKIDFVQMSVTGNHKATTFTHGNAVTEWY